MQGEVHGSSRHGRPRSTISGEYPSEMCVALAGIVAEHVAQAASLGINTLRGPLFVFEGRAGYGDAGVTAHGGHEGLQGTFVATLLLVTILVGHHS